MIRQKNRNSRSHLVLLGKDHTICGRKVDRVYIATADKIYDCERCCAILRRHPQLFNLLWVQSAEIARTHADQKRGV
jgi:hypothetical protein